MGKVISIGSVNWNNEEMLKHLEEFAEIYKKRPIHDNRGGMKSPHMFLAWFVLKKIKPKFIIESGVFKGQGTWLFEQACPDAQLHCIDLNLNKIEYCSEHAKYYDHDFSTIDWSDLPKKETLCFFDDHQNAYERLKTVKWFGFKHVLFEDNYPPSRGDCYSLKKAFIHSGFKVKLEPEKTAKGKIKQIVKKTLSYNDDKNIPPNKVDSIYLRNNIEIYKELPPILRADTTRWGDSWDDDNYPTPEPLLLTADKEYQQIFLNEAKHYTWMCYVKLK